MDKKYFTDEQLELLRQNPYVKNISHKAITYTDEFKTIFMQKYAEGSTPSAILAELGFDPRMLGRRRINGLVERMHCHMKRGGDCHDLRKECSGRPSIKELSADERIKRLEHQIKYLKQENEFLKKIEFLDRQAEWKEMRKQRRKKNSDSSAK